MTHDQLNRDTYHTPAASRAWVGIHQFQDWIECPARTAAELSPGLSIEMEAAFREYKWEKACFLVGQYIHTAMGEPEALPAFVEYHRADIYQKNGKPYAEFAHADKLVSRAHREPDVQALLAVGKPEIIMVGQIAGLPWKIAVDWLAPGLFADWKSASSFDDGWAEIDGRNVKVPWYYDYWPQMATYREIIRQNTGESLPAYIVGLRKPTPSYPPAVQAVCFDDDARLASALAKVEGWVPQVARWRSGEDACTPCGKCWWCAMFQPMRTVRAEWFG